MLLPGYDTTEAAALKIVTLTETPHRPMAAPPAAGDHFDSITRPGNFLHLAAWPDIPAALAAIATTPGHHRVIDVIRDYGMFARAEAPQYFPA